MSPFLHAAQLQCGTWATHIEAKKWGLDSPSRTCLLRYLRAVPLICKLLLGGKQMGAECWHGYVMHRARRGGGIWGQASSLRPACKPAPNRTCIAFTQGPSNTQAPVCTLTPLPYGHTKQARDADHRAQLLSMREDCAPG